MAAGNGVLQSQAHEERIQRLEQYAQEQAASLAATTVKLEMAAERISEAFATFAKSTETIEKLVNDQSARIATIERKEEARANRMGVIKKTVGAAILAGSGAAATKLVALLMAHF